MQKSLWGQLRVKQLHTKNDQLMPAGEPGLADIFDRAWWFFKAVIDIGWLSGGSFPDTSGKLGSLADESDVLTVFRWRLPDRLFDRLRNCCIFPGR